VIAKSAAAFRRFFLHTAAGAGAALPHPSAEGSTDRSGHYCPFRFAPNATLHGVELGCAKPTLRPSPLQHGGAAQIDEDQCRLDRTGVCFQRKPDQELILISSFFSV